MLLWLLVSCAFIQLEIAFAFNITFCTNFKCPDLSEYNIKCKFFENSIDCLRSINRNEVQLGYATAYEAVAATKLLPNIEVVADVRDWANSSQWLYEVVVVTNKPVAKFEELKNFTYCNYGIGGSIPKYIIDGLERAILKRYVSPNCGTKNTFDEEKVCNLNEFFGPSCRAGSWVHNLRTEDRKKWDYLKLCQLCPSDGCDNGYLPDKCLQLQRGAVAITPLHVATSIWNSSLYYLCQNGSTSTKPCVWHKQAWPLIFTHKGLKQRIEPILKEIVSICAFRGFGECLYPLGEILTTSSHPHISILNETQELIPILQPYKLDSSKNKNNKPIRWCTVSNVEYEKCTWLKVFSGTLIYPIECIFRNSTLNCVFSIENNEADMVELIGTPTRNNLWPIALSTTPYALHIETNSGYTTKCRDIFYFEGSVLKLISKVHPSCPFGLRYRHVCTNRNNELCHYHSQVVMRLNDPNRENAKALLLDLTIIFSEDSKKKPFDFFGRFNGVSDLLLQGDTADFYFVNFEEEFKWIMEKDNYGDSNSKSIPGWSGPKITPEAYNPYRGWKIFGIIVVGIIFTIFCFVITGGRICIICC